MLTKILVECPSDSVITTKPVKHLRLLLQLTSSHSDIVAYNSQVHGIALLELTCQLDSVHHWNQQGIRSNINLSICKLYRLKFTNYYQTIEISSLGHYQLASIGNYLNFIQPFHYFSRSPTRKCLDDAAYQNILASERIFLARNCKEWLDLSGSS